jgi:hypothetical protein
MKRSDIPDEEILAAIREGKRELHALRPYKTPEEMLAHKYPPKLILSKMERMIEKGILECGISVRTAWIVGEDVRTYK